ncbi:MAG: hypothetical protein HKN94_14060 [Acidimicrobiales bacterium]|nr:hypothetical protein [Acidimicrobiales bacterium]RZV43749.1 MAG: hypothetical protein EX269_12745 [Acidimicrobiales bacterium]
MKRLDATLLSAVGVLVVHQVAYTASATLGYESSVAHGHLAVAWLASSLAALVVLATAVTRSLRARRHRTSSLSALAGWIGGGYIVMESLERTYDGAGALSLFPEPVFWFGLVATPLVALGLRRAADSAVRAITSFVETMRAVRWPTVAAISPPAFELLFVSSNSATAAVSRRGPPVIR